jgi:transcriptional regulator with XRE-family HTH domain
VPGVHVTVNQVVAWNIAWFRKAEGLTQEQMGKLIGRSKRNVSADERSWDGGHTREFNASEIAAYAVALGIPIGAFFLPPEDDGEDVRYVFRSHDQDPDLLGMGDLMAMVMPDNEGSSRAMDAYRRRMLATIRRYMGRTWADDFEYWMQNMTDSEIRAEQAEDFRADREALLRIAGKFSRAIEVHEKHAEEGQ